MKHYPLASAMFLLAVASAVTFGEPVATAKPVDVAATDVPVAALAPNTGPAPVPAPAPGLTRDLSDFDDAVATKLGRKGATKSTYAPNVIICYPYYIANEDGYFNDCIADNYYATGPNFLPAACQTDFDNMDYSIEHYYSAASQKTYLLDYWACLYNTGFRGYFSSYLTITG